MCKSLWQEAVIEHGEMIKGLLSGEVQNKRRIEDRQEQDSAGLGSHQTRGREQPRVSIC